MTSTSSQHVCGARWRSIFCARDFHREAIVFLVIDGRGPDRGGRLFVFATTVAELFSARGITGFNETA
jgi:hypothetical protein